ncbi:MAG: hypothetical protein PVF58_02425 [Candidatus Methanofastidiosia archaeon]|jgi:hypothetical protein
MNEEPPRIREPEDRVPEDVRFVTGEIYQDVIVLPVLEEEPEPEPDLR